MTRLLLLLSLPCLFWSQGSDTAPVIKDAGIAALCVPPDQVESWKTLGFTVSPVSAEALASREKLPDPGIVPRANVASPTRSPWVNANGWRIRRNPTAKYAYELPRGKAPIAAAEAFAYGADAVLAIDPADVATLGAMLAFLRDLPPVDLPDLADVAVVDDGSALTGEVMNLLSRRNLLFRIVTAPSPQFRINITLGGKDYSQAEAADPSAFALKIRRQLTDEERTLRVYGSEVVIGRLTGDGIRVRLHLLNYGNREMEGLRIRVRGAYREDAAYVAGVGRVALTDYARPEGATEFSIASMSTYAIVDLVAER
jgi:hypothetical protein